MKTHPLAKLAAVAILALAIGIAGCSTADKEAKLAPQAKVTKTEAAGIALAKVPGGSIKESELEKEHGKLVWSFDIAAPDATDITEVLVNAITGEVVSVEKETAGHEAKEKAGEKKK